MKKVIVNTLLVFTIGIIWINISASDVESNPESFGKIPDKSEAKEKTPQPIIDSLLFRNPFSEIRNGSDTSKKTRYIRKRPGSVVQPELGFSGLISGYNSHIFILTLPDGRSVSLNQGDTIENYKIIHYKNDTLQLKSVLTNEKFRIGLNAN